MSLRTKLMQFFPWVGGVNTALDPSVIPQMQLTRADHVVFGTRGSRKKRDGINYDWDDATTGSASIVGLHEFSYGTTARTRDFVGVTTGKKVHSYTTGTAASSTQSADLFAGTAWSSDVTQAVMESFTNLCVIAVDGTGNVMKKWTGSGNIADLGGTPPQASMVRAHLGRLWCNDKTNIDRLHYSETGNAEVWNGVGDSAALDIGVGDGDPAGITAIFPSFHGVLYVAKRTKLYKVVGDAPENFQVILVSDGIGCVGPNAVCAVDQDEIYFISDRGVHALSQTEQLGDYPVTFVSADIQTTVNDTWKGTRRKYAVAKYVPNLNSVVFAVTDSTIDEAYNNTLWFFNIPLKAWYPWPNVPCQSLIVANDDDKKRMYFGTNVSRLARAQIGLNYDISTSGANTAISYVIRTGLLFPENQPFLWNSFKRFILFYRPRGTHTITVTVKVDNAQSQSISFSQVDTGSVLGTTLTLGSSALGYNFVMAPYAQTIDGHGHGIEVTITQAGIQEEAEIQGFAIEYEQAGTAQETFTS